VTANIFGLSEAEVARALAGVQVHPSSSGELARAFARVAWNVITEPGDRDAGALRTVLGPEESLRALVSRRNPAHLQAELATQAHNEDSQLDLEQAFARWMPRVSVPAVLDALTRASSVSASFVMPEDLEWPTGLDDLGVHAPVGLWVRGRRSALETFPRSLALVGARASTGYGEHVTMEAAAGLVDHGVAIVSGAAYGIDGTAHRAALISGGTTMAFLAGGVDRFYPSGHEALLTRILDDGAVIAEVPCGAAPTKWRFLQRNRLIAAASTATVVVEAGWRSGSLNTAHHAAQLGRPLGIVPGPVTSASSAGCHRLLRSVDATCVTNAIEMLELLTGNEGDGATASVAMAPEVRHPNQVRALDALSQKVFRPLEKVTVISGMSTDETMSALGLLEAEGCVTRDERGWWRATGADTA
jgi:DNA processing protein